MIACNDDSGSTLLSRVDFGGDTLRPDTYFFFADGYGYRTEGEFIIEFVVTSP